jgi:hypothetical protein
MPRGVPNCQADHQVRTSGANLCGLSVRMSCRMAADARLVCDDGRLNRPVDEASVSETSPGPLFAAVGVVRPPVCGDPANAAAACDGVLEI